MSDTGQSYLTVLAQGPNRGSALFIKTVMPKDFLKKCLYFYLIKKKKIKQFENQSLKYINPNLGILSCQNFVLVCAAIHSSTK